MIKVLPQIELGKYAICSNRGTIDALNRLPGPRFSPNTCCGVNWAFAVWFITFAVGILQLGGVALGVGQSLAIMIPLSGDFAAEVVARQWMIHLGVAVDTSYRLASLQWSLLDTTDDRYFHGCRCHPNDDGCCGDDSVPTGLADQWS